MLLACVHGNPEFCEFSCVNQDDRFIDIQCKFRNLHNPEIRVRTKRHVFAFSVTFGRSKLKISWLSPVKRRISNDKSEFYDRQFIIANCCR